MATAHTYNSREVEALKPVHGLTRGRMVLWVRNGRINSSLMNDGVEPTGPMLVNSLEPKTLSVDTEFTECQGLNTPPKLLVAVQES